MIRMLTLFLCLFPVAITNSQSGDSGPANTESLEAVKTNVPGVIALRPIPSNLDAETVSDSVLARYGLPPRPDRSKYPEAFRVWTDLFQAARDRVTPELTVSDIFHQPIHIVSADSKKRPDGLINRTSSNWSGFVITDTQNVFNQTGTLFAYYTAPGVSLCYKPGPRMWSAYWVGIDGGGTASQDVLQVGTSSDQECNLGVNDHPQYYAWLEWYPSPALIADRQVPIVPGDSMFICVFIDTIRNVRVVTVRNLTRLKTFSMAMTPPSGTHLLGDTIEWVVERPQVNGALTSLAPYTRSSFQMMQTYYQQGALVYRPSLAPTGTSYSVTMVDSTPNLPNPNISTPTLYPGPSDDAAWFVRPYIW